MFVLYGAEGKEALDRWIARAQRCCIPALWPCNDASANTAPRIDATLDHGLVKDSSSR